MITFFPFRASIDKSGICSEFSENNSKIQDTISYFFSYAFRKSKGLISEDIIYYLCLDQNTLLFRIDTQMKLTGMFFKENEIISSWNNLTSLIIYLFSMTYDTVLNSNSAELSESSFTAQQISSASYITDAIEKKYRNRFIPISFIAGKDAYIFYQHDLNDIDYPISEETLNISETDDKNIKVCISYKGESETVSDTSDTIIFYRTPENKRKSLMQILKGKKDQNSDFLNNLFIKTESGDVLLSTRIKPCTIADEPSSFLFRLDKIAYTSGGSQ